QVAALCSVYLHEVDDVLSGRVTDALFDAPVTADVHVQMSSLDVATILAISFGHMNSNMINTIRRFLTTPSPIFDLVVLCPGNLTIQQYAVKRLTQCIQIRPSAQIPEIATSTLYSFLNHISLIFRDTVPNGTEAISYPESRNSIDSLATTADTSTRTLNDDQKLQVCVNAIVAIAGVACHLRDDKVTAAAYSMLILRRRSLSPAISASLLAKLVDLALIAPQNIFADIVSLFANISKEPVTTENKMISSAVLSSQLALAQRINVRPELYAGYLQNLLNLFVEKGNTIQRTVTQLGKMQVSSLAAELGILLPVLRALLSHRDFHPQLSPSEEAVSLFRNAWFHCILYGFVSESMWVREWHESIMVLAKKTPPLVLESATNYLDSDLEYNSVLRRGLPDQDVATLRQNLTNYLPNLSEIKSATFAQLVFLLSIYHIETMRSRMGSCTAVLQYFMNQGVNNSSLVGCIEAIADKVRLLAPRLLGLVNSMFIIDATAKATTHAVDDDMKKQLRQLLILCCHRLKKVHSLAIKYTSRVINDFPHLLCDKQILTLLLELAQLLWLSCDAEYRDEYCPVYEFTSPKVGVTLEIGDSYTYRKDICAVFYESSKKWLLLAVNRAPMELNGLLQDYLAEFDQFQSAMPPDTVHMGRSLALEVGRAVTWTEPTIEFAPKVYTIAIDNSSEFVNAFTSRRHYRGEITGMEMYKHLNLSLQDDPGTLSPSKTMERNLRDQLPTVKKQLSAIMEDIRKHVFVTADRLNHTLYRAAALLIALPNVDEQLIRFIVWIPVQVFTPESLKIATAVWIWIVVEKPTAEKRLMVEMSGAWSWAQRHRKGLFSPALNPKHPFEAKMTYTPSDKAIRDKNLKLAAYLFSPHVTWIHFLSSRFHSIRYRSRHLVDLFLRLLQSAFDSAAHMSTHPLARESRFQLLLLGLKVLKGNRMEALIEYKFRSTLYHASFDWFSQSPKWYYGAKKTAILAEYKLLTDFYAAVNADQASLDIMLTCSPGKASNSTIASGLYLFVADHTKDDILKQHRINKKLLQLFLESELARMAVWSNPMNTPGHGNSANVVNNVEKLLFTDDSWKDMVRNAWDISPLLAIRMASRFTQPVVQNELQKLISCHTADVLGIPEALVLLLGDRLARNTSLDLKYLPYWAAVPPITAASYFSPSYGNHPLLLQYAMRSLEYFPVDTVFFYVPQIVQALRHDELGYVERYIMEAGQSSQLFAHQIIWNMKANFFVDADKECLKPDILKPTLERIIGNLVSSFTGQDKAFYEREFKFFTEITSISGKLKDYIKLGQTEKKPAQKKRLDEELAKIEVEVGVYLPSNPEGKVVDINRKNGRALQSHAKAPFMASFLIEKDKSDSDEVRAALIRSGDASLNLLDDEPRKINVWQSAIFKVGDDCRQDVLALQLIAIFKNIFTSVGMDLYVFPYRIVATAPGCGVIDVIPNSISRDQLGREKVNSLYDYFLTRYGGVDSIKFQQARNNFIQSAAAYSVISYLLQIKDRHNGNIMLDDDGHIVHIDFGFILDIAPGGGYFEVSPFKLTTEMVQVMGGSQAVQQYKWFCELVIKAFLASRPYADQITQIVSLMLGSELPCFRPETLKRLRARFQLEKTERAAADFMIDRIKDSFENQRTVIYDYFQKITNGIPF
ncbi:hypothetical protein BC936DRAFT_144422, partial [Jimgerdemannia flammicorona]